MRRWLAIIVFGNVLVLGSFGARAGAARPAGRRAESHLVFYTVKWGFQDEFLDLFQRNHDPILKAREKAGQFLSVRTFVPAFTATDARTGRSPSNW